jgi:hypothetical protein
MLARALLLTAVAVAALAPPASATTLKTVAGTTVPSGGSFSGSLKSGTAWHLEGGAAGDIDCSTSTVGGTIGTNPSTPSVAGSLTSLTFANCTDTIPFVTVSCVYSNVGAGANAKTLTWTYVPTGSTWTWSGVEITVCFSNGSTCVYQPTGATATATHNSNTSPWNNEYAFNQGWLTKVGGTFALCPSSNVTWTATYLLTSGGSAITIQP